jgi:hypothetical protein
MTASRPLPNRVDPFGALHAVTARGALMGNRGGRFHLSDQTLGARRWASRRWIACLCAFKARRRVVWGDSYTELFFLDEATAFAAGHRPCFECRRNDARRFAEAFWGRSAVGSADDMDAILHRERLDGRNKRTVGLPIAELSDGAMIVWRRGAALVAGDRLFPWSFNGYAAPEPRPLRGEVEALTPPSILQAFARGYRPVTAIRSSPDRRDALSNPRG